MTSLTDVFVTVKPDMDKFGPEVKKKLARIDAKKEGSQVAGRFGVGFNGAFGGIVKHSAGLFVGAFAAIKGAQIFGGFINDARESAKVSRITAAVIKSTGGVAGITAAQIGDLATAISNKTGADDEAIQSGENLLATFTNIRNQTGKGNDIFNRATQSAVDLAAAMNNGVVDANGLKAANIQLGKALNDPVKGVTALQKVGVSFTAQQKKQIKTLVESGNVLGAQKIILGEVGKEFGGAAAAAADPLTRLQTIAGNLAEKFGGFLLPSVDKFATFVGDTAIPKISAFSDVFAAKVTPKLQEFGGFVKDQILPRLIDFGGFIKDQVLPNLVKFGGFLTGTVVPAVATFGTNLATTLGPAVKDVFGFFKTEVLPRLKDFGSFLGTSVLPKIGAMATSLSKNKDFLVPFAATILTVVAALKVWAVVQGILNVVLAANPLGLIVVAIAAFVAGLVWAYKNSETFRNIVNAVFGAVSGQAIAAFETIVAVVKFTINWVKSNWPLILGILTGPIGLAVLLISKHWTSIKNGARDALAFVVGRFLGFVGTMISGAAKAFGWVPGIGPKLRTAAAEFGKFRDSVNNKLNGITDQVIKITPIVLSATGSKAAKSQAAESKKYGFTFARGGGVFGEGTATSDSIPAMLSNGEHVWTAKEVQKAGGHGAVEQMRQSVMKYAKGGAVGLDVESRFPSLAKPAANIAAAAGAVARPVAQALVNAISMANNSGLNGVLSFVKSQVGKPYLWGGVGPGGYDCSGLVSAAINTAFGRNPYRRLGATGSMPWGMFAPGPGAFEVGWFKGSPGHTAATVNGINIESSGGRGVHMGPGARGARNGLFTNRAHVKGFADGGRVGDAPYDTLHNKKQLMKELGIDLFDRGGRWKSGTIGANMSGRTETVVPGDGAIELGPKTINALADAIAQRPNMLDGRLIDTAMSRMAMGGGYR